jgi:large subunit ribosomal protein L9
LKVILTKDYEKLGNAGDTINVKDGFAKNFLIPGNIAALATPGNLKQMEIVKKSLVKKEAKSIEEAKKIAEIIDGFIIKVKVNSSPEGKLYGSITNKDIAERILSEKKVEIDKKKIEMQDHIKEVGTYNVEVKLFKEVKAVLKVQIESDDVVAADQSQNPQEPQEAQEAQNIAEDTSSEETGQE